MGPRELDTECRWQERCIPHSLGAMTRVHAPQPQAWPGSAHSWVFLFPKSFKEPRWGRCWASAWTSAHLDT